MYLKLENCVMRMIFKFSPSKSVIPALKTGFSVHNSHLNLCGQIREFKMAIV